MKLQVIRIMNLIIKFLLWRIGKPKREEERKGKKNPICWRIHGYYTRDIIDTHMYMRGRERKENKRKSKKRNNLHGRRAICRRPLIFCNLNKKLSPKTNKSCIILKLYLLLHQDCIAHTIIYHKMIHLRQLSKISTGNPHPITTTVRMRRREARNNR